MATEDELDHVNIRPRVTILSVLPHLNYKPWFALAEFVDNSVQSFLDCENDLRQNDGSNYRLRVVIESSAHDDGQIIVRDNAAGIHAKDYARAFRPAEIPPDRHGLSEFGMGMKSAACWFAKRWTVRTAALGESVERTVTFDIESIVRDDQDEVHVTTRPKAAGDHYTEIVLSEIYRPLYGRTIGKIKEHLASIYRVFTRDGVLDLRFEGERLAYFEPKILVAPYFRTPDAESILWRKEIDLDFGDGQRAHGFAALRERGSTAEAGFALFRRQRLIQGSGDEGYRPAEIFGASNTFTYQRLFGELHLEGFEVSHTKDGFRWDEHEEIVLDALKDELDREPVRLLAQADGYRTRVRAEEVVPPAQKAVESTAATLERESAPVLEQQLTESPDSATTVEDLPTTESSTSRQIELTIAGTEWDVEVELAVDPSIGDWLSLGDRIETTANNRRRLAIRLNLAHPFMERFGGPWHIEGILRVATSLALAEVTAREGGVRYAGTIRKRVNELLRDALSKP